MKKGAIEFVNGGGVTSTSVAAALPRLWTGVPFPVGQVPDGANCRPPGDVLGVEQAHNKQQV